ncbi:hypothetical protein [Desulfobulbus sp.]|uniref:hypothetical protein n=1 Tax=Desulfobulbus sp. TaxID=895 RepID=UPI0027BABCD0|nr:hypothetical protein [Desulfobulbus sp.]
MNDQEITKQVDEETSYIPLKDLETLPDAILAQLYTMGGQLPGYGGGDKVLVLLEPGEFVIRKESAAHYGESFLHALNDMRLDASSINTEHAHADGPGETVFFDFRPPAGIPAEQARDHLEQIEDNNEAISAITMALSTISLLTMKPRCETCGQWHDILTNGRNVGGLYSAIHALTDHSNHLTHEARRCLVEQRKEGETAGDGSQPIIS